MSIEKMNTSEYAMNKYTSYTKEQLMKSKFWSTEQLNSLLETNPNWDSLSISERAEIIYGSKKSLVYEPIIHDEERVNF